MTDAFQGALSADSRIAYALVFGSTERRTAGPRSDLDLAIGLTKGVHLSALEIGEIVSRLEAAARTTVDLVILDLAPPGLAYRVFRDGRPIFVRDRAALVDRKARAVLEYLDFQPIEALFERSVLDGGAMVDRAVLAAKIAAVRDAVARIREVLPSDRSQFLADRTLREVAVLNLFVALQESLSLATHWLADAGLDVPQSYAQVFQRLGERGVIPPDLATRLAAASGLRNFVAYRYAALDWQRIHEIAATRLDDLLAFCDALSRRSGSA